MRRREMSRWAKKRPHALQQIRSLFNQVGGVSERILFPPEMKRPPRAAVPPKSDDVFGSGGCESGLLLALSASPTNEAHDAQPTGKERQSGWQRGGGD